MLAEFGGLKTLTALKTRESILLFTQKVGIQQDNNDKEKDVERRVKKRVRTRGQFHWLCQTSNITKYSINNIHKDHRLRADLCQKILSKCLVLIIVDTKVQN